MFGTFISYVNDIMDYSTVKRKVVADNISNFNTPDYKAKTVDFDQIIEKNSTISLQTNNEKHISNHTNSFDVPNYEITETSAGSSRIDGNNVDQTKEMINMLKNNSLYSQSVNAINSEFSLIKTAIGQ